MRRFLIWLLTPKHAERRDCPACGGSCRQVEVEVAADDYTAPEGPLAPWNKPDA